MGLGGLEVIAGTVGGTWKWEPGLGRGLAVGGTWQWGLGGCR